MEPWSPNGVWHRDSHEILSAVGGGGTQAADFTRGFTKGKITKTFCEEMGGGQGDPDPLIGKEIERLGLLEFLP